MSKDKEDRERAILSKFRRESEELGFSLQRKILLTRVWEKILIDAEEYEMAGAMIKERQDLSKQMIKQKRKSRTFVERLKYWLLKFLRRNRGFKLYEKI